MQDHAVHGQSPAIVDAWADYWRDAGVGHALVGGAASAAMAAFWRNAVAPLSDRTGPLRLIELAAGAAPVLQQVAPILAARGPLHLVSLDQAPEAAAAARQFLPEIEAVTGSVDAPPFPDAHFDAVFSQFGVEYAGASAFARGAALVAPGGVFAALIHRADGPIASACAAQAAIIHAVFDAGFFSALRESLAASYARPLADVHYDQDLEAAYRATAARAGAAIQAAPPSTARELVRQYCIDATNLATRRFAYLPDDGLGWLDAAKGRLEAYALRMRSMTAAALTAADIAGIAAGLAARGFTDIVTGEIAAAPGEPAVAHTLSARAAR